jgi:UDP:flavonoid glycosyltransferase YjiC (YdhE family)
VDRHGQRWTVPDHAGLQQLSIAVRFLCVSAPLAGHLDWGGYLATAAQLRARGHEVVWASGAEVAPLVARAGVPFVAISETGWRWPPPPPLARLAELTEEEWRYLRGARALDQWLDPPRVEAAVLALAEVAADVKPDVIVSEMFIAAAGVVAEQIDKMLLVAGWPAFAAQSSAGDALTLDARQRLARILAAGGCRGVNFAASEPPSLRSPSLHLTFWSERWYAGLVQAPQTHHAGGLPLEMLPADPYLPSPAERPWVMITLGTTFNRDPAFFVAAAAAADQLGCLPIVLLGRTPEPEGADRWLARLPAGTVVRTQADFRTLLPYAVAAIHHGGAGTTHALVRAATPQVVVPHAADQIYQAHGVTRAGVGIHLPPKEVTVERLVAALATILPDLSAHRAHAVRLRDEFAALGGVPAAAALIERVAESVLD